MCHNACCSSSSTAMCIPAVQQALVQHSAAPLSVVDANTRQVTEPRLVVPSLASGLVQSTTRVSTAHPLS